MISEALIHYLKNCLVSAEKIKAETRDEAYRQMPERQLASPLKAYAQDFFANGGQPRMIAISGLRGVGKTTLMWQVAEYVHTAHSKMIFFISVDDLNRLGASLYEAFQVLEQQVLGQALNEMQDRFMFLIDEVHEAQEWDKDMKILYEKAKRAFILCTGSSALLLHKSPDLATRWSLVKLFPFRFPEYIHTKIWAEHSAVRLASSEQLANQFQKAIYYSENFDILTSSLKALHGEVYNYYKDVLGYFPHRSLDELIDEYISYHNIARFLKIQNKALINERVIALFERIMLKDLPDYSEKAENGKMMRLLMRLALSDEINFQKLAKEFRCPESEIETLITTLDKAEILNVLYPYGGVKSKTSQNRKAFFMSPSLRRALYSRIYGPALEDNLRAKLYEDIVAMYLRKSVENGLLSFGQSKDSRSPDFVIETRDKPIVIEVGSNKKSSSQISNYDADMRYGIIISAKETELTLKKDTVILPLSWFLLS